jgi:hypothetical protein
VFVSIKSSPYARFPRSLETRCLSVVLIAAAQLEHIRVADALEILVLVAVDRDARFDRPAVRWIGRLLTETPPMSLRDARFAIALGRAASRGSRIVHRLARRR